MVAISQETAEFRSKSVKIGDSAFSNYLESVHANFSADYPETPGILGYPRLRPAAALRYGGGSRHIAHRYFSARHRTRAVARSLCATIAPSQRWPLWRKSQPSAALLSVSGCAQAGATGNP